MQAHPRWWALINTTQPCEKRATLRPPVSNDPPFRHHPSSICTPEDPVATATKLTRHCLIATGDSQLYHRTIAPKGPIYTRTSTTDCSLHLTLRIGDLPLGAAYGYSSNLPETISRFRLRTVTPTCSFPYLESRVSTF